MDKTCLAMLNSISNTQCQCFRLAFKVVFKVSKIIVEIFPQIVKVYDP